MEGSIYPNEIKHAAADILTQIEALPVQNTPNIRAIRRKISEQLKNMPAAYILILARELLRISDHRSVAYELIYNHSTAFESLTAADLEELGSGIKSWWSVDSFARTLAGPVWSNGQISDDLIIRWAHSDNLWWRRAALVCTVALNIPTRGSRGDTDRTLQICRLLVGDHEDMVVKGMSWALRELVPHDPVAVEAFLQEYEGVLAARVKREVRNKLATGLKNPKKRQT